MSSGHDPAPGTSLAALAARAVRLAAAGAGPTRWRRFADEWRADARRGWAPPTPGQVAALLAHPGAVLAALVAARRLEVEVAGRLERADLVEADGAGDMLRHVTHRAGEALERAGVTR